MPTYLLVIDIPNLPDAPPGVLTQPLATLADIATELADRLRCDDLTLFLPEDLDDPEGLSAIRNAAHLGQSPLA